MKLKQYLTFKNILIVGLIITIFLVFKECSSRNKRLEKALAENAKINEQKKADSLKYVAARARWQDSITHAAVNSDLQVKVIKETEKKLSASQSKINQLTAVIRLTPGPDSLNGVLVTKDFKDACDSLPNEIDKLNTNIGQLQQDNTDLVDLMNYEIIYRDSLIEAGDQQIGKLNNTISHKNSVIDQALKAAKPRGRLLGGVGLIGNELNPLGGTKINIAYQSKGGKQYQVGGILMKGGVWYEASVLITLIK